jgi:hypothetical protein
MRNDLPYLTYLLIRAGFHPASLKATLSPRQERGESQVENSLKTSFLSAVLFFTVRGKRVKKLFVSSLSNH